MHAAAAVGFAGMAEDRDASALDARGVHLIHRVAEGDREALVEIYRAYQRPLFAYLRRMTPDQGLAEELLQDTLVAAWQSARSFEARSSVQTWLFGIARRQAHNSLRRRGIAVQSDDALAEVVDADPSPEAVALARADSSALAGAVAQLSPIHREVLVLKFVNGLSYEEMALVVGVPEGTIKSRLNAARKALRRLAANGEPGE